MRILITGASGFVGQAIIKSLSKEITIDVISRNYSEKHYPVNQILKTYRCLETNSGPYNAVIHLAGLAHDTSNQRKETDYFEVNEGITKMVVDWMNKSQKEACNLIYLSSIKTYSNNAILNEDCEQKPDSVYGRSKLAAEKYIRENLNTNHTQYILQPVMIYGEGNKGNLPRLFHMFKKIPFPFKGVKNQRSILSINNLICAIEALINNEMESGKYILCDDKPISTYDMLESLFVNSPFKLRSFALPEMVINLIIKVSSLLKIQVIDKVLGNLVAENTKIKQTIGIQNMPFETQKELEQLSVWK